MLYSTDRKRGVSLIFVNHHFFGNLLKKWFDKIRMYNKDYTRLQNKGVNLIVCLIFWTLRWFMYDTLTSPFTGADKGGWARRRRAPPLKLEKIWFFGVKSWFFTRNTPTIFGPPSAIGKNMIFWHKIVFITRKFSSSLTWNPGSAPEYYKYLHALHFRKR